jgi:translation elongation factor EF-G
MNDIKVPEEFMGDVMCDLPSRRGLILGIEVRANTIDKSTNCTCSA